MLEKSKKRGIIIAGISAIVLIAVLGVSFAFYNYSRTTDNQLLVAGDIYMKYTETNQLVIKNALPSKEPGEDYFEFKITGKNTYSKPIWYEIVLNRGGDDPEGRTERLLDKFLMFRLVETKDGVDTTVVDNASYEEIINQKIWVNTIPANTPDNIKITYKLYMWISYDTKIGNTAGDNYDMETWNNKVFASVRVSVNGDFEEKELDKELPKNLIERLKAKADQEGEIIAVDNNGDKCDNINSCEVRDYRFSGSGANNYIKLNNSNQEETWRIIGVFKDESGEEYTRIVGQLPGDIPDEYVIDGTTYKIKTPEGGVYYNYINGDETDSNDWSKAGLQYYLNTEQDSNGTNGYMSHLSEETKLMIRDEKYYLGSVNTSSDIKVKEYYNQERAIQDCEGDVGSSTNNSSEAIEANTGCHVWNGYKASWLGKVGLLYPSDYVFSLESSNWNITWDEYSYVDHIGALNRGDLYPLLYISPSSSAISKLLSMEEFRSSIYFLNHDVNSSYRDSNYFYVIVLALKNSIIVTNGEGTDENPYEIAVEQ